MVPIFGHQRLRGTAALQATTNQRCHKRMAIAGGFLEGVRSAGAVQRCQFSAGNGCEGPQPSRPPPIILATNEWPWPADSLEGVRSVDAVKRLSISAHRGCQGTALQAVTAG
jgi:hypothetical protein